jgi:hypothetical protein
MKFIKTYESFKESRNKEAVNEEFLGGLFGNLFKKIKNAINKTKGGKEVEQIYQKWRKIIEDEIQKQANITLQLDSTKKQEIPKPEESKKEEKTEDSKGDEKKQESYTINNRKYNREHKVFEAEKVSKDLLKKKEGLINQIIKKNTDLALKEMDDILKKFGGSSANPSLAAIINSKKTQFEIDVLTSQVKALEEAGESKDAQEIAKQRDEKAKASEQELEKGINTKPVEYNEGDEVIYLKKDKKIEDWNSLSDEDKKNPSKGKADEIVGVGKIKKRDGDNFIIEYAPDKTADKVSSQIISKSQTSGSEEAKKAAESLGKIKDDSEKMKVVGDLADILQDESKKDKVEQIKKIISEQ